MTEAKAELIDYPHTLYRFYDAADQLLYIGITANTATRWTQHSWSKSWWPQVAKATVEHFDSREAIEEAEVAAIKAEKPLHNIVHNNDRPPLRTRKPRRKKSLSCIPAHPPRQLTLLWHLHEVCEHSDDDFDASFYAAMNKVVRLDAPLPPGCSLRRSHAGEWSVDVYVGKPRLSRGSGGFVQPSINIPVSNKRGEQLYAWLLASSVGSNRTSSRSQ